MTAVVGLVGHGRSIVTSGLIFHVDASLSQSYPGSGTTWTDLSSSASNATLINGATFNSAYGGSLVFSGSANYATSASNTGITGTAARTLCAWVYPTASPTNTTVIRIGSGANSQLYELQYDATNITGHFWGTGWALSSAHGKSILNTWTHLVMAYNGTTVSHYVDGVFKGSGNFALGTTNSVVTLSLAAYGPHFDFAGRMATSSLYNRGLTSEEILQNYNAGRKLLNA